MLKTPPSETSATTRLQARRISLGYDRERIIDGLSLSVPNNKVTTIIGPNACGKSTLLRALARLIRPISGATVLDGQDIAKLPTREVARRLGLLPQSPIAPEGIVVSDLVARGRLPHRSAFRQWSLADEKAVVGALEATGMLELADRRVDELSGGQRQRAWIAMAIAQQTDLLLLDEPTTFLDLSHQIDVLNLVRDLNRTGGRTVVLVLHDLNLAARYADHIVAMRGGRIVAEGTPHQVVTAATMEEVFNLECQIIPDPTTGTPLVIPAHKADR